MFVSNGALVLKTPQPFFATDSNYFPYMPGMSNGWPNTYGAIYRQHLWVYTVINKLAKAAARLPLPVYERKDDDRPRLDSHPLAQLLRAPNEGMTGYDLWIWTSSSFDIFGEAFWFKKRANGAVVALYPLNPASMTYDGKKRSWRFDNGSSVMDPIADTDLVHFRSFHPDGIRGLSPLEPLRSTLENEWHARNATSSFWLRGARPGVALQHPGNLSEPAQQRLKAQWESLTAGSGNTGASVVLEEGMKAETLTLTAEEAQYIETRKLNREEVCGAFDVPPPVVHILDRATFSNITEQMRSMYRDTMAPRLKHFEAAIELDLRRAEWPNDNVYAEFLMDEVLRGDFEARQAALNSASHMTIAEKRRVENLPFIEGTDRIFLNTATLPLDAIDAQAEAIVAGTMARPVPPALPAAAGVSSGVSVKARAADVHVEHARSVLAAFFTAQGEAVAAAGVFDEKRWDAELGGLLFAVSVLVATAAGRKTLHDMGLNASTYDAKRTEAWLRKSADGVATGVNAQTKTDVADILGDPAAVSAKFEMYAGSRAALVAGTVVTAISGFGTTEAVRQTGQPASKTWVVTSGRPRPSHAAMSGETVGIDDLFSNGGRWPGDSTLAPDERAGCTCELDITTGSRGIPSHVARRVMGRLGFQKSLAEVDPEQLVDGLNGHRQTVLAALDAEVSAGGTVTALRERIRRSSRD